MYQHTINLENDTVFKQYKLPITLFLFGGALSHGQIKSLLFQTQSLDTDFLSSFLKTCATYIAITY